MTTLASACEPNHSRLRHWSPNVPLKLGLTPFCHGLPGSLNAVPMPRSTIRFSTARDELRAVVAVQMGRRAAPADQPPEHLDDAARFSSSRSVGAFLGLTPKRYQSGETDKCGAVSKVGDTAARVALFEAAHVLLTRVAKWSALKAWGVRLAQRRGAKWPKIALARKLTCVLLRIWVSEAEFRYPAPAVAMEA
jgi:hypothetical protein